MNNHDFIHFVIARLFTMVIEFASFYMVVLLCEWFAAKRKYNIFKRACFITAVTFPMITIVIWTMTFSRHRLLY